MKNPFKSKKENTALNAVGITGAVAVSLVAYLYLSDGLTYVRKKIAGSMHKTIGNIGDNLKDESKNIESTFISDKNDVSKHTVKALASNIK